MSREEAHRRPEASGTRVTTEPLATGRAGDEPVGPQPPLFIARTDRTTGVIRTRGHLDRLGAEALCRIATALQTLGHREIVVQLGSATIADDVPALLADHARRLGADGVRLLLR